MFFRIKTLSDLLRITNEDKVRTTSVQQSFLTDYIVEIRRIISRKVGAPHPRGSGASKATSASSATMCPSKTPSSTRCPVHTLCTSCVWRASSTITRRSSAQGVHTKTQSVVRSSPAKRLMNHLASGNSDINLPRAAERAAKKLEQLTLRSAPTDEKRLQRLDDFDQVADVMNEVRGSEPAATRLRRPGLRGPEPRA